MIEDVDVAKFSRKTQIEIRAKVRQLVERGHDPRHLKLDPYGGVFLDRESVETDAAEQARRGDFDR